MSLSKSYFDRYSSLFAEIKTSCERLSTLQSTYDKKVSNIYHEIESQEFGIPEGYKLARELKHVLQERRIIKDELVKVRSIYSLLEKQNPKIEEHYNRAERKSYELRQELNTTLSAEAVLADLMN